MFPCSSIYQHFPRPNQTPIRIDEDDHHGTFQNGDDHYHYHHRSPVSSNHPRSFVPSSIFEDDDLILSHLLSQRQLLACNVGADSDQFVVDGPEPLKGSSSKRQTRPKPTAVPLKKKDRHSKIYTAQGLRDRRMRLSVHIARKFFDLQDMLGFDKASRTIDWLFSKSRTAIKELKDSLLPKQRFSSCDSTSGVEVLKKTASDDQAVQFGGNGGGDRFFAGIPKAMKRVGRKARKAVARVSRDKARARARERTAEKMLEKARQCSFGSEAESNKLQYVLGVSSWANTEVDFHGFPQNWDIISNPSSAKTQSFCHANPAISTANSGGFYSTQEQKPSLVYEVPTSSQSRQQNPSLVFLPRTASNAQNPTSAHKATSNGAVEKNPNPVFMASLNIAENQDENPPRASNFFADSNIFRSLNF